MRSAPAPLLQWALERGVGGAHIGFQGGTLLGVPAENGSTPLACDTSCPCSTALTSRCNAPAVVGPAVAPTKWIANHWVEASEDPAADLALFRKYQSHRPETPKGVT